MLSYFASGIAFTGTGSVSALRVSVLRCERRFVKSTLAICCISKFTG